RHCSLSLSFIICISDSLLAMSNMSQNQDVSASDEASENSSLSQHTLTEQTHLTCPLCNRICASKTGLSSHVRAHLRREGTPQPTVSHNCNLCNKVFPSKAGLSHHQRQIHPKEYNYQRLEQLESVAAIRLRLRNLDWPAMQLDDWQLTFLEEARKNFSRVNKDCWNIKDLKQMVEDLITRNVDIHTAKSRLEEHAIAAFPHLWKASSRRLTHTEGPLTKKAERRAQYTHIQTLYHHRIKDAAKTVLDGNWQTAYRKTENPVPGFIPYWESIFTSPPVTDRRPIKPVLDIIPDLIEPIQPEEVTESLRSMHGSAPGLDRIRPANLRSMNPNILAGYYNLMLANSYVPNHLNTSRITFVPKVTEPREPSDFRPITVSSCILRCMHKIIAKRWVAHFPQDRNQFGFLERDGCFESTAVLHAVLRHSHSEVKDLALGIVDLSKAFDSVCHQSLIRSAAAFGAPVPLLNYLENTYSSASVSFNGTIIHPERGVRQGDPLSPLLFIMSLDEALNSIETVGFNTPSGQIKHIAYADDLLIFCNNSIELQSSLNSLTQSLRSSGLCINPDKSRSLCIRSSSKPSMTILESKSVSVSGMDLPPIDVDDQFQYLGIGFDWKGKVSADSKTQLIRMLEEVTRAPLKPQQRVSILRNFLIPRLIHKLVLSVIYKQTLKSMDQLVRAAVRKWLRLPKDTPTAFFHAAILDGGLGIPHFSTAVIFHRRARLERALSSRNPDIHWAVREPANLPSLRIASENPTILGTTIDNKTEIKETWSKFLYESHDGCGLKYSKQSPISHEWLKYPQKIAPRLYIRGIHLRAGILNTKVRKSRGGRCQNDLKCRGSCGHHESLSHVIQSCQVTNDARCQRHNFLVSALSKSLAKRGYKVLVEPRIPTNGTFIKPDLVIIKDRIAQVIDVTVTDESKMEFGHQIKIDKYGSEPNHTAIDNYLKQNGFNHDVLQHMPFVVNLRGLIYKKSLSHLHSCGLTNRDMSRLCLMTIVGSLKIYDVYMRGTNQYTHYRQRRHHHHPHQYSNTYHNNN
uniref:ribonuclease H n=1 Tax=Oryzias sinensis TaxID=183150 RepID=A0A8C7YCS3_9TELE